MNINLRELKETDAKYMLEWMHDIKVQSGFQKNMLNKTLDDAISFCINSKIPSSLKDHDNIHYAIVNDQDEYIGTISLKDINTTNRTAEYSIVIRPIYQNKGIAYSATLMLLNKAFNELDLHKIYLNVLATNKIAISLYEKCGFVHEGTSRNHVYINNNFETWEWYGILKEEFILNLQI